MSNLILYSYFRSSASYRVRIALHLKKLNFEYRAIHLLKSGGEQNSAEYKKLNPLSQVPCLVHGEFSLTQSVAIIDYLDSVFPNPKLFPQNPMARARCLELIELINSGIQPLHNLSVLQELNKRYQADQNEQFNWASHFITKGLTALEERLHKTSHMYSLGDTISALDCALIPQLYGARRVKTDLEKFPTLLKIEENCLKLDAFQKAHPEKQIDCDI